MGRHRTIKVVDTAAEDRRRLALAHAIAVAGSVVLDDADDVVAAAKKFEKFLKGK